MLKISMRELNVLHKVLQCRDQMQQMSGADLNRTKVTET